MDEMRPITFLCIASYFKGEKFIRECKRMGCRVILLTRDKLLDVGWPREAIDEVHAMPDLQNREHVINGVSFLARRLIFDIIVAVDACVRRGGGVRRLRCGNGRNIAGAFTASRHGRVHSQAF